MNDPSDFSNNFAHGSILGLSRRKRHYSLFFLISSQSNYHLKGHRNQSQNNDCQHKPPITITVNNKGEIRSREEKYTKVRSTIEVANQMQGNMHMRYTWSLHELTKMLNRKTNVRLHMSEKILLSNQAPILLGVRQRVPIISM